MAFLIIPCVAIWMLGVVVGLMWPRFKAAMWPHAAASVWIDPSWDPGALDDAQLRKILGGKYPGRGNIYAPSKMHDRVQNAFERLLAERERTLDGLGLCERTDGWVIFPAERGTAVVLYPSAYDAMQSDPLGRTEARRARLFRELL